MNNYQVVRRILLSEQRRREGVYRFRPTERVAAMKEIADGLVALERMRKASEWKQVGSWWTDKFD